MTDTAPIVTLASIHNDVQEIKRFMYRAQSDYKRITDLEEGEQHLREQMSVLKSQVAALMVTHSILIVVLGGIALAAFNL